MFKKSMLKLNPVKAISWTSYCPKTRTEYPQNRHDYTNGKRIMKYGGLNLTVSLEAIRILREDNIQIYMILIFGFFLPQR